MTPTHIRIKYVLEEDPFAFGIHLGESVNSVHRRHWLLHKRHLMRAEQFKIIYVRPINQSCNLGSLCCGHKLQDVRLFISIITGKPQMTYRRAQCVNKAIPHNTIKRIRMQLHVCH